MPGIRPAVVESMLFLQPSLMLYLVPRAGQSLDPIWSTQATLFCIGFLGHRAGSKMSVQSPYCWREKRTLQGLLELFVLVFHGGEKSDFLFWAFSLPGLYHCPTERVSMTREAGARAQMKYRSGQY